MRVPTVAPEAGKAFCLRKLERTGKSRSVEHQGERCPIHFDYGILDRELAGFAVSEEHFRRHIPERLKVICFSQRDIRFHSKSPRAWLARRQRGGSRPSRM